VILMSNSNKFHNNDKDKNSKKDTSFCKKEDDKVKIYADVVNIHISCCK